MGRGGGEGQPFNVIGLRYVEFLITTSLFIGVYNNIFIFQNSNPVRMGSNDSFLEIMPSSY